MRRALAWSLVLVALLLVGLGIVSWTAWRSLTEPFQAYSGETVDLSIEPGLSARQILDRLYQAGVIQETFWARLYLGRYLDDPTLKAGEYRFSGPATTPEVLARLARGEVLMHEFTVIEGLDLNEIASHLATAGFGAEEEFLRLMSSPDLIADLDPDATNLEGYVFPDTYAFARGIGEGDIVATMVETFRRHWLETIAPRLPEESERTMRQVVTLASIVERETGVDDERATVAGVYAHRLRIGMGLYADPTVIYALKQQGTWDGNLRRVDLEIDSPYNTYRYPGLPPGPISSPGLASLQAAAQPADVPYLYFVSRNDGTHVFARTLAEHNRNVDRWQKQYWRERWARQRAEQPDTD